MKTTIYIVVAIAVVAALVYTFTQGVSETGTPPQPSAQKLNIDEVCQGALAYMTFPDGKAAEAFVADCKAGKHPEVIERYKKDNGMSDGATI